MFCAKKKLYIFNYLLGNFQTFFQNILHTEQLYCSRNLIILECNLVQLYLFLLCINFQPEHSFFHEDQIVTRVPIFVSLYDHGIRTLNTVFFYFFDKRIRIN